MLRWLDESPAAYGFAPELWTGRHLARLIEEAWGVTFHPRSLARWLRVRGFSPQRPQRVPRERDQRAIDSWRTIDCPRIKNGPPAGAPHRLRG